MVGSASGSEYVGVVFASSIGVSPGDDSLVGGDGGCGMSGDPGGVL